MHTNIPLSMETILLAMFGILFTILAFVSGGDRDGDGRELSSGRADLLVQDDSELFGAR